MRLERVVSVDGLSNFLWRQTWIEEKDAISEVVYYVRDTDQYHVILKGL